MKPVPKSKFSASTKSGSPSSSPTSAKKHHDQIQVDQKNASPSQTSKEKWKAVDNMEHPSMTWSLFVYWVLPIFILAVISRFGADTELGTISVESTSSFGDASKQQQQRRQKADKKQQRSIAIQLNQDYVESTPQDTATTSSLTSSQSNTNENSSPASTQRLKDDVPSNWPTAYSGVLHEIARRQRRWGENSRILTTVSSPTDMKRNTSHKKNDIDSTVAQSTTTTSSAKGHGASTDPERLRALERISQLRRDYHTNPDDLFNAIAFADALRYFDVEYRDGGSMQQEAITIYTRAVQLAVTFRQRLIDAGQLTNMDKNGHTNVNNEVILMYDERSADGIVCGVYTSQGKLYFMANMFKKAVTSYTHCLEVSPDYLDARNSRASALLILGKYKEAADDFLKVINQDQKRLFSDAFTGLARILQSNESVAPTGWDTMVATLDEIIPQTTQQMDLFPQAKQVAATALSRYHQALFIYHDTKTKNADEAWHHLEESHRYKMSLLPKWHPNSELMKVRQTMQIFRQGFWPPDMGSQTRTPVFIIGFPRSGSTLLERVLDAHPMIVGTGENSVFNGRLDDIRNQIVRASVSNQAHSISSLTRRLAEEVVDEMKNRWEQLNQNAEIDVEDSDPQRFVDKMLTNYNNVGFIHMLYPRALILHVYREPMDTLFSAFKHEFPSGTLDYTNEFASLAELYTAYRELIDHWDNVLPGRITHVCYEDMVHNMPGMARAIIDATDLPWNESVLDFHKKKHAVNTLSTTQVRKGVYKDSLESWKKYKDKLLPLTQLVGDFINFKLPHRLQPTQVEQEL